MPNYQSSGLPDRDRIWSRDTNEWGDPITTYSNGTTTATCADQLGRPLYTIVNPTFEAVCQSLLTAPENADTYYTYPGVDRNLLTQTKYNSLGQVSEEVDGLNRHTHITYDALGRPERVISNYRGSGTFDPSTPDINLPRDISYDLAAGWWGTGLQTVDTTNYLAFPGQTQVFALRDRVVLDTMVDSEACDPALQRWCV